MKSTSQATLIRIFFQYSTEKLTSDYLDMLLNLVYMPIITKATRNTDHSATLDHIYTNAPQNLFASGICLADISDHLPWFCTLATKLPMHIHEKYRNSIMNYLLQTLQKIYLYSLADSDVVNCRMNNVIEILQEITDKHAK